MSGYRASFGSNAPPGVAGRLFLSLFFLVFLGMGSLFAWFIARDAISGLRSWTWKPTECEITTSRVREVDDSGQRTGTFGFEVQYRYTFCMPHVAGIAGRNCRRVAGRRKWGLARTGRSSDFPISNILI